MLPLVLLKQKLTFLSLVAIQYQLKLASNYCDLGLGSDKQPIYLNSNATIDTITCTGFGTIRVHFDFFHDTWN